MDNKEANIDQYMEALSTVYKPAQDPGNVTHWFSTDEVCNAIKELNPGAEISKEQIYDAMISAGYRYQPRPGTIGLDFRWMLQAK